MINRRLKEAPYVSNQAATTQAPTINNIDQVWTTPIGSMGDGSQPLTIRVGTGCLFQGCIKMFKNRTVNQNLYVVPLKGVSIDGVEGDGTDDNYFLVPPGQCLTLISTQDNNSYIIDRMYPRIAPSPDSAGDTATQATETYSATQVNSIITELRAVKAELRDLKEKFRAINMLPI